MLAVTVGSSFPSHEQWWVTRTFIQAHYDPSADNFLVATGTFDAGTASPILVWQAKETRERCMHCTRCGSELCLPGDRRSFLEGVLSASPVHRGCELVRCILSFRRSGS